MTTDVGISDTLRLRFERNMGPEVMNLPGFRLHKLSGEMEGHYTVSVSGNWRVTFRFKNGMVIEVDYLDYH